MANRYMRVTCDWVVGCDVLHSRGVSSMDRWLGILLEGGAVGGKQNLVRVVRYAKELTRCAGLPPR
jgi:hypothetical protein